VLLQDAGQRELQLTQTESLARPLESSW
jgi:hypothetical protein